MEGRERAFRLDPRVALITLAIRTTGDVESGFLAPHFLANEPVSRSFIGSGRGVWLGPNGNLNMNDAYFWIAFFGAPLFLLLITAFVFRPSAREQYSEAKRVIFADEKGTHPRRASSTFSDRRIEK